MHLRLPELFKEIDVESTDAVTGRRLVLGNDDVRLSYVVAGRPSPLYRNAIGDECVYVESGRATVETIFGPLEARQGDYVLLPRATTHRWVPDPDSDEVLRLYCIEANSHITPARRYLSKFGQLLEHAPFCERDLHGPGELPEPITAEGDVEVYIKHRGDGPGGIAGTVHVGPHHPFDLVGWDGCLYPYTFNVADFEPITGRVHQPPPAHQVFEGNNFVDLQLRAAQGRLPPAVDPGAVLPLERRLRRGDVLLRRQLRGAQGIGHRPGFGVAASRRALARAAAGCLRTLDRGGVLRRARRHGRHLPPAAPGRGRARQRRRSVRLDVVRARPRAMRERTATRDGHRPGSGSITCRTASSASKVDKSLSLDIQIDCSICRQSMPELFAAGTLDALARRRPRHLAPGARGHRRRAARPTARRCWPWPRRRPCWPYTVADYVDFYASEQHATNAGRIFRPGADPLTPNWKHLPVGYHGRAGTVVVSGTAVRRPRGQFPSARRAARVRAQPQRSTSRPRSGSSSASAASPARRSPSTRSPTTSSGVTLLNDWSARDIQGFETVPLGPHLGKSFATSVSAWITPLDALDRAWRPPPPRDRPAPRHLDDGDLPGGLDLELTVSINGAVVSRPPFATMYWTPGQLLAQLTSNGAPARTGDLLGSGTVSGPDRDQFGSLLELAWNGTDPVPVGDDAPDLARGRRRGGDHRDRAGQRRRSDRRSARCAAGSPACASALSCPVGAVTVVVRAAEEQRPHRHDAAGGVTRVAEVPEVPVVLDRGEQRVVVVRRVVDDAARAGGGDHDRRDQPAAVGSAGPRRADPRVAAPRRRASRSSRRRSPSRRSRLLPV